MKMLVLIKVATSVQQESCFGVKYILFKLYTLLYREKSGGERQFRSSTAAIMY